MKASVTPTDGSGCRTCDSHKTASTARTRAAYDVEFAPHLASYLLAGSSGDGGAGGFRTSARVALIRMDNGLSIINSVKGLTADLGRRHVDLYEAALCDDMLTVRGDELFYASARPGRAVPLEAGRRL